MKYHKSPADLRLDKLQAKKILNEIRANRRKLCAPIDSGYLTKVRVAYFPPAWSTCGSSTEELKVKSEEWADYLEAVEVDSEVWAASQQFK